MPSNTKEYMNNYYQKNKDKFKQVYITCECGLTINRTSRRYHILARNHLQLMAQKNEST